MTFSLTLEASHAWRFDWCCLIWVWNYELLLTWWQYNLLHFTHEFQGEDNLSISRKFMVWSSQVVDKQWFVKRLRVTQCRLLGKDDLGILKHPQWSTPKQSQRNSPRPVVLGCQIFARIFHIISKKWSCQWIKPCKIMQNIYKSLKSLNFWRNNRKIH